MLFTSKVIVQGKTKSTIVGKKTIRLAMSGLRNICLNSFSIRNFNTFILFSFYSSWLTLCTWRSIHSNLDLMFRIELPTSRSDIPTNIVVSLHITAHPSPCIITFLTISMYHRAGTIWDNHCNICGIFSMGKIIPDSNSPGSITNIAEMITALI